MEEREESYETPKGLASVWIKGEELKRERRKARVVGWERDESCHRQGPLPGSESLLVEVAWLWSEVDVGSVRHRRDQECRWDTPFRRIRAING